MAVLFRCILWVLLAHQALIVVFWRLGKLPPCTFDSEYDYIVVGGGSAGCVLASRLSENPNITVLLLEAGDSDTKLEIHVPLLCVGLQLSEVDWAEQTVPQTHACRGLEGGRARWPRGKTLGGSSSINDMIYTRGNREDFDRWAALGAEGWSYQEILQYFIKSEDFRGTGGESEFHGTGGPLTVSHATQYRTRAARSFVEGVKELGYPEVDYNGRSQLGVSFGQFTIRDGRRWSTAQAFLHPAVRDRQNLHVVTGKSVRSLSFAPTDTPTVDGVHVVDTGEYSSGQEVVVRARREVILSASTVGTTKILLLSGIGPRAHLEEVGIPVRADLPVGENLQDHVMVPLGYVAPDIPIDDTISFTEDHAGSVSSLLRYTATNSGPLSVSPAEANAFLDSDVEDKRQAPDLDIIFSGGNAESIHFKNCISLCQDKARRMFGENTTQELSIVSYAFFPTLLHPTSRGTIRLNKTSPLSMPLIDPNYLSDPRDVDVLLQGIRFVQKIANSSAFDFFNSQGAKNTVSDFGSTHPRESDDYWRDYIRHLTLTQYHPVGTCRMGQVDNPATVVDSRLWVKGVRNLRVADASVMPEVTSGNTNAPVIMIAEKASDMIKEDFT